MTVHVLFIRSLPCYLPEVPQQRTAWSGLRSSTREYRWRGGQKLLVFLLAEHINSRVEWAFKQEASKIHSTIEKRNKKKDSRWRNFLSNISAVCSSPSPLLNTKRKAFWPREMLLIFRYDFICFSFGAGGIARKKWGEGKEKSESNEFEWLFCVKLCRWSIILWAITKRRTATKARFDSLFRRKHCFSSPKSDENENKISMRNWRSRAVRRDCYSHSATL